MLPHGRGLLPMIAGPTLWALYFVAVYATAAVMCAKFPQDFDAARTILGIAGLVCAGLASATTLFAALAWRRNMAELDGVGLDADTLEARRGFLAFSGVLLGGLSVVAILFTAAPTVFAATCQ